jgi:hypothetical protein
VMSGSFLVDAESRLNPAAGSIYFGGSSGSNTTTGTTVRSTTPDDPDAKITAALNGLSAGDRELAERQYFCPILKTSRIGSMGPPVKLMLAGETVFLCCAGCKSKAMSEPEKTATRVKELRSEPHNKKPAPAATATDTNSPEEKKIQESLAKLAPADRELAIAQRFCVILKDNRLGSMGPPVKIVVDGETVFLCCAGCEKAAKKDPQATAAKAKALRAKSQSKQPPLSKEEKEIAEALAGLSPADRELAIAQRFCPVADDSRLGSMGTPTKIMLDGKPVFLCCEGCEDLAKANPKSILAKIKQFKAGKPPVSEQKSP